ncbi:hypothetical protein [Chromobacterium haemolyticum]|uniref:hypothetical protein n=1 Tax=Chromobacterium haemolyticum TaxID=394935 RepID=UPI00174621E1|nr:hypothetical protein [Chromobacterium haemolyticum]QOD81166.1 hypothetical protein IEZ30_14615 [Chromobacterium haemolyticum]
MIWRNIITQEGINLVHIQQDPSTNQCVAACVGMIAQNAGYWSQDENALFKYGASAIKRHFPNSHKNMNDIDLVSENGIPPEAVACYLRSYGWSAQSLSTTVNAPNSAGAIANTINNMNEYDSCILICGHFPSFHALAAIRRGNRIYTLNPTVNSEIYLENAPPLYTHDPRSVVRVVNNNAVEFIHDLRGNQYWKPIHTCHYIKSQYRISTIANWLVYSRINRRVRGR